MPEQILKTISVAEAEAETIEKQAQQEARDLLAQARVQAAAIIDDAGMKADSDASSTLKKAEDEAALLIERLKSDMDAECAAMKSRAAGNIDAAVACIVGRIVNASGNR